MSSRGAAGKQARHWTRIERVLASAPVSAETAPGEAEATLLPWIETGTQGSSVQAKLPAEDRGSTQVPCRLRCVLFKQRKDGVAREYFYGYDTTGGHSSGPSIKSFTQGGIQRLENTDIEFEPRYTVELAKAGDRETAGYFARPFGTSRPRRPSIRRRPTSLSAGPTYKIQCPYCNKTFTRKTASTRLNEHKDTYGNRCYGRVGIRVW